MTYPEKKLAKLKELDAQINGGTGDLYESAAALNAPTVKRQGRPSQGEILQWALKENRMKKLRDGESHSNEKIANGCMVMLALIYTDASDFNGGPLLQGLVNAGILTEADRTALLDAGARYVSPAQDAGLPPIKAGYIEAARAL